MSCDPQTLMSDAQCLLSCIPSGLQPEAQTAIIDIINGGPTPTNTLLQNAKEYIWRVPPRMQVPLQIYLMLTVLEGTNRTVDQLLRSASCMRCIPKGYIPPIQTSKYCEWSEGGQAVCDHPVVLDWLARLAADFQPRPSDNTIRAVCDLCKGLDASGIMDKMLVINPVVWDSQMGADSFLTMRYPLIYQVANGYSPFINYGFVNADLTVDGLGGDGSKYTDTGFNPASQWGMATDSAGIVLVHSETSAQMIDNEVECAVSNTVQQFESSPTVGQGVGCAIWNVASTVFIATAIPPPVGFYGLSRTSDTALSLYQASSTIPFWLADFSNANQFAVPLPNGTTYFMAGHLTTTGTAFFPTYKRISFLALTEGLGQSESNDLYELIQIFRTQLGGGTV